MIKRPSISHLHVWGCSAKARPYRLNERKLDSRTISCFFLGYSERSMGFKFYDPSNRSFFEQGNAKFIEKYGNTNVRDIVFEEEISGLPTTITTIATNNERKNIMNTITVANL